MKVNPDLRQYGKLLKDGELRVKSHFEQKVRVRYIFLFDQVILMCKTVCNKMYSFKEILHLKDYTLDECSSRRLTPRDARGTHQFCLKSKAESANTPNYTIFARTEDPKQAWVKAISEAL